MVFVVALGILFACAMAVFRGRRRARKGRRIVARLVSLRSGTKRIPDTTIGLRDPARPF